MLVGCQSCQKKFTIPDSAITEAGRLLQCGSCGNKWTQYPVKGELIKENKKTPTIKIKQPTKEKKIKNSIKNKKRKINLYSEEYLKRKHGLEIKETLDGKKIKRDKKNTSGLNFFGYLIIAVIIVIALLGILNMTKTFLITSYPFTKTYINSLYEVLDILKMIILNLIN